MEQIDLQYYNIIDNFINLSIDMINEHNENNIINIDKIELTINEIIKKIDFSELQSLINQEKNIKYIQDTLKRYYYIYFILLSCFDLDVDQTRVMLLKNKIIGEFILDTNNTAIILDLIKIIKNFINLLENGADNIFTKDISRLLYDMFDEEERKLFLKETPEYKHNIIKTIISLKIYQLNERPQLFKILEEEELSNAEFTYIDIIDSLYDEIDYATIEKLFNIKEIKQGVAELMYQFLIDYEETEEYKLKIDTKINTLFDKKILIPITDEFLRYHKDSERYEKNTSITKIEAKERTTKKDNTKIRYIVTKINKLIDYYNIKRKGNTSSIEEVNKLFFPSLNHRKAVIINEIEELNIINKIVNQGITAIENNEYYADLISFRSYPYINFKDYKQYGITFKLNTTVEAIRYCNFEFKDQSRLNNNLQLRIAPKDYNVNIVGVGINPYKLYDKKRNFGTSCIKLSDTKLISDKYNGYLSTIHILKNQLLYDKSYNKLLYWIFNLKNDRIKINLYENVSQLNNEEYFKLLLSQIYDEIVIMTYDKIISEFNEYKINKLFDFKQIIEYVQNQLLDINYTEYYYKILDYLYHNKLKIDVSNIKYDINEDRIPGLNTKLIDIPTYVETKKQKNVITIKKQEFLTGVKEEQVDELLEYAICQHQISWDKMNLYKKKDPNRFNQELFIFIKKFVIQNEDKEYICKSCYQDVDIKNKMSDSYAFNLSNVALSASLEADLENIPEYEKYSKAIKNMDKNVEKIGMIAGINLYVGNNPPTNKYKRHDIIKNTIDLILLQYKNFDVSNINMRKERLESANKLYGVDKNISTYFIFDMSNDLYTYSSKDTDKYKRYKNDNILAYMIFLIICELNVGQIIHLTYDKLINYIIFDKFAHTIFDGIKIRINNGNDIVNITNYRLLCYLIYYFSSMILKYNLWFNEKKQQTDKVNPQLQKVVIHTVLDMINSILEVNSKKDKDYRYENISTKFFIKLDSIYNNKVSKETLEKLSSMSDKKIEIIDNKIKIKAKDPSLILSLENNQIKQPNFGYNFTKHLPGFYYIKSFIDHNVINNLLSINEINNINQKLYQENIKKVYQNFNNSGVKRKNTLLDVNVNEKELEKHANQVIKNIIKFNTFNKKDIPLDSSIELQPIKDINLTVDKLIDKMEHIIGNNININNMNIYLKKTIYIIDHDHLGNKRSSNLILLDSDNKIEFKKNDSFFKMDVYVYTEKSINISIYYHPYELYLLGYKEMNKEYTIIKNSCKYLKINHSIKNKLLLLGHNKLNYIIDDEIKNDKKKLISFTEDIIKCRIANLKNIIKDFQLILYQIKNKQNVNDNIIKIFIDKFKNLNYFDNEGYKIFSNWKNVIDSIYFSPLKQNSNIELYENIISVNKLIKFNNADNSLLSYFIDQLNSFIDINTDQYNQSKLIILYSIVINYLFDKFNSNETILMNNEVKKFNLLLTNVSYTDHEYEFIDIDTDIDEDKLTDEQKDKLKSEKDDTDETNEGMDMDIERDDTYDETDDGMDMIQDEGRD